MQTLFWADGDGLPRPEIGALCAQLSALLDAMALETGILISNYEQVGPRRGCAAICLSCKCGLRLAGECGRRVRNAA